MPRIYNDFVKTGNDVHIYLWQAVYLKSGCYNGYAYLLANARIVDHTTFELVERAAGIASYLLHNL